MSTVQSNNDYTLLTLKMRDLARPSVLVEGSESIRQTATRMTEEDSFTALIVNDGKLCGIVTDQNFRVRVIAQGRGLDAPIASIMTPTPLTLPPTAAVSEALLLMANHNIRHIPVFEPFTQAIYGVVAAPDLLRIQGHNAVYLIGDIHQAQDVASLQRLSLHLPQALIAMVRSNLTAYHIAHALSSIGQAINRRLLQLAEQQLGAPPVPYAFIVAGSLARHEQIAHSDQDNALILADEYVEAEHGAYFAALAKFVSDGLNACGYVYCQGEVMATNPAWRQTLSAWKAYFRTWLDIPQPKALLYCSIFFDLRCLYGDESLLQQLQAQVLQKAPHSPLFLGHMAGNALTHTPPLRFFRGFALEKTDAGCKVMNMKKRGIIPIIDLARVYALAAGIPELNTFERLQAIGERTKQIPADSLADLKDAFEFICTTRLRHQAGQLEAGKPADHCLVPEEVSALEQRHLRDAFAVVAQAQQVLSQQYQTEHFR